MSMRTLKDLGKIVTGNTPKMSERENFDSADIPFIKPGDISDDSITVINKGQFFISENARDKARILPSDSILVTCIGIIGKVGILTREAAFNQQINGIVPDINSVIPRYLAYAILSQKSYLQEKANAAVVPIINKSQFSELKVEVPNLQKQNEIVRNLDKVDHLISLQKQQLKGLDELVKSRFVELFGNPVINQKRFPVKQVGDVIDFIGGSQPPKNVFEYTPTEENIRLIQIRDYRTDKYKTYIPRKLAKRFCTADDIMIGRYGPPIFQILGGIEGSYNVALMKAVPKMGNREFIRWFLKQECLLHYLEGMSKRTAGQDGIQMDKLKKYPFPYPPIELQNQFANFAKQLDKSKYREAIFLYLLEDVLHML
jgi:type I restriction enzyme S subunit